MPTFAYLVLDYRYLTQEVDLDTVANVDEQMVLLIPRIEIPGYNYDEQRRRVEEEDDVHKRNYRMRKNPLLPGPAGIICSDSCIAKSLPQAKRLLGDR